MNITILEKAYQRNGVSGSGFLQVKFRYSSKDELSGEILIAILPIRDTLSDDGYSEIEPTECFVVNPLNIKAEYRGDNFGYEFSKIKSLLN